MSLPSQASHCLYPPTRDAPHDEDRSMSAREPEVDVSVVLAVHNEQGHLAQEIRRIRDALEASSYSFEVIAVDDGSTDGSSEELAALDGIRLIRFSRNRGTGSARKAGTRAARG